MHFADLIANMNDFNNHAYNRFVEKIKVSSLLLNENDRANCRRGCCRSQRNSFAGEAGYLA